MVLLVDATAAAADSAAVNAGAAASVAVFDCCLYISTSSNSCAYSDCSASIRIFP
jgi:hypothetical protein